MASNIVAEHKKAIIESAKFYTSQGIKVFPIKQRGKKPWCNSWKESKTENMKIFESDISNKHMCNIGVACGEISKKKYLIIIDLDTPSKEKPNKMDGVKNLKNWEDANEKLKSTFTVRTGTNGKHLYYFSTKPFKNTSNSDIGIDIRCEGGYVVGYESIHENGNKYEVENFDHIQWINPQVEKCLSWIYKRNPNESINNKARNKFSSKEVIAEGGRVSSLVGIIASMRGYGISKNMIESVIRTVNKDFCKPPLSDEELEHEVLGAIQRLEKGNGNYLSKGERIVKEDNIKVLTSPNSSIQEIIQVCEKYKDTDSLRDFLMYRRWLIPNRTKKSILKSILDHNNKTQTWSNSQEALNELIGINGKGRESEGLIKDIMSNPTENEIVNMVLMNHDLIFNKKSWYEYINGFWNHVEIEHIKSIINECLGISTSGSKIKSIYETIQSEGRCIKTNLVFNENEYVNFSNGTLELQSGILREARRDDFIDYKLSFPYNENAVSIEWDKFIHNTLLNDSHVKLLQEYLGYTLFSDCSFEKALFLQGEGSNGKSTLISVIEALFGKSDNEEQGSLISNVPISQLNKNFATIELKGKAVNLVYEFSTTGYESTQILKSLISGDSIKGEKKFKDPQSFKSRAKFICACNTLPDTPDSSYGFMRKIIILPFPYKFVSKPYEENEKPIDRTLGEKLKNTENLSGIFNWMYQGYKDMKQHKLKNEDFSIPNDIADLINSYETSSNHLITFAKEFKMEKLYYDEGKRVSEKIDYISNEELYERYKAFCENNNYRSKMLDKDSFLKNIPSVFKRYRKDIESKRKASERGYQVKIY